jgi:hypothetical protein
LEKEAPRLGFMRAAMLLASVLLVSLLVVAPPRATPVASRASTADERADVTASPATEPLEAEDVQLEGGAEASLFAEADLPVERVPRTTAVVNVHIGPSANYSVVGVLPRSARLEVVGRNPSGAWLAIVFSPGSTLTGWIDASKVTGIDVSTLEIAAETPLGISTPAPPARQPAVQPTRTPGRRR